MGEERGREAGQTGGGGLWKRRWPTLLLPGGGLEGVHKPTGKTHFPRSQGVSQWVTLPGPPTQGGSPEAPRPPALSTGAGKAQGRQVTAPTAPALPQPLPQVPRNRLLPLSV